MALALAVLAIFVVASTAASGVASLLGGGLGRSAASRAGWVVLPAAAATSLCMALLKPGLWQQACHCVAHGLHHPHLCLQHPAFAEAVVLPASAVAGVWSIVALPKIARVLRSAWETWRWSLRLLKKPIEVVDTVAFRLIQAPGLGACTTGLFRPLVAIDASLWQRLDEEQRRAVLHHEHAHCLRRDPLSLFVLGGCAALGALPGIERLLRTWQARAERECDQHAVAMLGAPEPVASALLALQSYHLDHGPRVSLGASGAGASLERRVRDLLQQDGGQPAAHLASDLAWVAPVGLLSAVAFAAILGDLVHHGAETVLGLLSHHP